jgi:2-(1,2-epoxy-1,2-dihydrophenyl)acetyl-CoA isomerase
MRSTDSIRVEVEDGLAILTLAQPARGNPFDGPFGRDFKQVASDLLNGAGLRAVLPIPVVTAVQGFAMGGGVALLAGCDVVLAGASARLGSAFAQIGFSCDSGSTITLTSRMGLARARRFVLLAEVLGSEDALRAGLIDQIVADAQLQDDALALARKLAAGPTVAYGETKRLFMRVAAAQLEAQLEDEALTLARVSTTHDAQEGIAAQVERRKPAFLGR